MATATWRGQWSACKQHSARINVVQALGRINRRLVALCDCTKGAICIPCPRRADVGAQPLYAVPDLTRGAGIQLNKRLSLRSEVAAVSFLHRAFFPNVRAHRGKAVRRSYSAWRPFSFECDDVSLRQRGSNIWNPALSSKRSQSPKPKETTGKATKTPLSLYFRGQTRHSHLFFRASLPTVQRAASISTNIQGIGATNHRRTY